MSVQDTSIQAYHDLIQARQITPRAREILRCLVEHGPQADFEIAAKLGKHPSQVSARRGDLVNDLNTGLVVSTGQYKQNPFTNKTVKIWRANVGSQPSLL
jgi:DNA-binding CsgD family transcriptional regulator